MPKKVTSLTAAEVKNAGPGRYADGDGLYLLVRDPTRKYWLFRYTLDGKQREMGLGVATNLVYNMRRIVCLERMAVAAG